MKTRISVLLALGCSLSGHTIIADEVNSAKMKTFVNGKAAIATEVNGNFGEVSRAIKDNFTQLNAHKNDSVVHGGGTGTSIGGDGSGSTLSIDNANWVTSSPSNFNWTDCTVGLLTSTVTTTLTVPSGTTIRCQNGFTLTASATIIVGSGYGAGFTSRKAIPLAAISSSLHTIPAGGAGNTSGGYLRIVSNGPININGKIIANGKAGVLQGNSAGAGGVILLESRTDVSVTGAISANGGAGAPGKNIGYQSNLSPSGGGGGGIIAFVAPVITATGLVSAKGGSVSAGGNNQSDVAGTFGKSSGGTGGVPYVYPSRATPGTNGHVLKMIGDPATLIP